MIKLVRLDYRLLHGQVVFSWTQNVGAQRIIVVDDNHILEEGTHEELLAKGGEYAQLYNAQKRVV